MRHAFARAYLSGGRGNYRIHSANDRTETSVPNYVQGVYLVREARVEYLARLIGLPDPEQKARDCLAECTTIEAACDWLLRDAARCLARYDGRYSVARECDGHGLRYVARWGRAYAGAA